MLRAHTIDTDKVYRRLLALGDKQHLLPEHKFLNLNEYQRATTDIILLADDVRSPRFLVVNDLMRLWYPGALFVIEARGITATDDIDLEIESILQEAGYPDYEAEAEPSDEWIQSIYYQSPNSSI